MDVVPPENISGTLTLNHKADTPFSLPELCLLRYYADLHAPVQLPAAFGMVCKKFIRHTYFSCHRYWDTRFTKKATYVKGIKIMLQRIRNRPTKPTPAIYCYHSLLHTSFITIVMPPSFRLNSCGILAVDNLHSEDEAVPHGFFSSAETVPGIKTSAGMEAPMYLEILVLTFQGKESEVL